MRNYSTAIPKREGRGVFFRGLTILIKSRAQSKKTLLSTCFLVFSSSSQYGISVTRYIHIYPFREHTTHYLYHFLRSAFVKLTFEKNFLLAINSRCYTTLFTYLKYPSLLFYVLFKEKNTSMLALN